MCVLGGKTAEKGNVSVRAQKNGSSEAAVSEII
jgi:hypothetical protein